MASAHSLAAESVIVEMPFRAGPRSSAAGTPLLFPSVFTACRLTVPLEHGASSAAPRGGQAFCRFCSRQAPFNHELRSDPHHDLGTCILSPLLESWRLSWWGRCDTVEREWTFSQIGGLSPQITSFVTLGQVNAPQRC